MRHRAHDADEGLLRVVPPDVPSAYTAWTAGLSIARRAALPDRILDAVNGMVTGIAVIASSRVDQERN